MSKIVQIEIRMVDLKPKVLRTDAIQAFVSQETPIVRIIDSDGAVGVGYSYTIGQGGPSVIALIEQVFAPMLIGRDPAKIGALWHDMLFAGHAMSVGPIMSLALAAIDIALWDLKGKVTGQSLSVMTGGAKEQVPLYTTEGGWLHLPVQALVEDALKAREQGFLGSKVKIGRPHLGEDGARLGALRDALGADYEIMTDANQSFSISQAKRRARVLEEFDIAWFEEPMPADDILGHRDLAKQTSVPIAVGESMYSLSQFKDYLQMGACSIIQADVARVGGITPWLKIAHLAEAFNVSICPHFLMEIHASLCCGVQNAPWLEYIPQLDEIAPESLEIRDGKVIAPDVPGLGLNWDWAAINGRAVMSPIVVNGRG